MSAEEQFDGYAKVELMGHNVLIARVSKAPIGDFIRCDVLTADGGTAFTKLVNPKAIYAINLVSREAALALTKAYEATPPATQWELPKPELPAGRNDDDNDDLPERWNGDGL